MFSTLCTVLKRGNVSKCIVNCKGMHVFYTVHCTVLIKGERFLKCTVYSSNKGGNVSKYIVNCKGMHVFYTVQCPV